MSLEPWQRSDSLSFKNVTNSVCIMLNKFLSIVTAQYL